MATEFTFLTPLGWERRAESLAFAQKHGLGLEVAAFISGRALNDAEHRAAMELHLESELSAFAGQKTFHGAFMDLALHSNDQRIVAVAQSRMERDLLTAIRLGCEKIVFHLGFNPLIGTCQHHTDVVRAHVDFWRYALASYPGILICLENQWEPDWTVFSEIFDAVQDPRLGMCLDVAHVHVHGHHNPEAWVRRMSDRILHMHWNDNHGDRDSHLPLGGGNIAWPQIFTACGILKSVSVTLEMSELRSVDRSISFLTSAGLLPRRGPGALAAPALTPK